MAQSYQHTREVDIIGGGGALLFGAVSVFVLVTSYGAPDAWASFVTLAIALFFLWLYLWEGKVRYQVHQDGLHFTRFFRDHVLAWSEVEAITWNEPLHAITIRSNGRNRLFIPLTSSQDYIHSSRKCGLAPAVTPLRRSRLSSLKTSPPQTAAGQAACSSRGVAHADEYIA